MFPPDKKLYPDYDAYLEKSMIAEDDGVLPRGAGEESEPARVPRFRLDDAERAAGRALRIAGRDGRCASSAWRCGRRIIAAGCSRRRRPEPDVGRHSGIARCIAASGCWNRSSASRRRRRRPTSSRSSRRPPTQPKATLRMKLDAHKSDANCAACHRKIDPLGLAFDNYDAIGRWRTEEVVQRRRRRQSQSGCQRRAARRPEVRGRRRVQEAAAGGHRTSSTPRSSRSSPPSRCAAR